MERSIKFISVGWLFVLITWAILLSDFFNVLQVENFPFLIHASMALSLIGIICFLIAFMSLEKHKRR